MRKEKQLFVCIELKQLFHFQFRSCTHAKTNMKLKSTPGKQNTYTTKNALQFYNTYFLRLELNWLLRGQCRNKITFGWNHNYNFRFSFFGPLIFIRFRVACVIQCLPSYKGESIPCLTFTWLSTWLFHFFLLIIGLKHVGKHVAVGCARSG